MEIAGVFLCAKQTEANCIRILSDYNHFLKEWKLRDPDGEWHPLFAEALDRLDYTEYLLDISLSGTAEEKSAFIRERGKEVEELGKRISGFAAGRMAEQAGRRIDIVRELFNLGGGLSMKEIPIWEKSNLNLEEAAAYSGIGVNKLREITNDEKCTFVLWVGNKRLIKRRLFDEYIERSYSI